MGTLADARAALLLSVEAVERQLKTVHGISFTDRGPGVTPPELIRADDVVKAVRKAGSDADKALRKGVGKMGDRLFEYADKSTGWVAKKATELAWAAWRFAAGPLLILGALWLLTKLD